MSRVIKFRAWDKKENVMRGVINLFANGHIYVGCNCTPVERLKYHADKTHHNLSHHLSDKDCEVMQFTGLLDKNGKEIYEGDVVKYDESEEINHWVAGETAVVLWVAPRFTFRIKPYSEFNGSNQNMPSKNDSEFLEVIGNIYENPELIAEPV